MQVSACESPLIIFVLFLNIDFILLICSLGQNAFSRAYINFVKYEDIFLFRDKFDGYVFVDAKGM